MIPLIIHLFSKRQVKIIPFSSLKHLKEMQKRQVRRIKIRQLLLLILRMLIILAAVLAFARPATKGGYIGSHAGVSSVILLDRSASMQREVKDGRLFDLAKTRVFEILKNFGQSDEILLIPFDRQTYFPAGERFFGRDVAENILKETGCGYDSTDIGKALKNAGELLAQAKNLNKELYLFTDYQVNSIPPASDSLLKNITAYFVELPLETDGNCGVTGIDLGGQLIEVGAEFKIKAEIANYDNRAKDEELASLFIDGIRIMQTECKLPSQGKEAVQFSARVDRPGLHSGWVEINDDGLPADNRFYFTFRIPEKFNVLIADGDGSGELMRLALIPSPELERYWSVKMISPDRIASARLTDYDVIVLAGITSLGTVETSQIHRYLDGGGGALITLGARTNAEYFNSNFGQKMGLTIQKSMPPEVSGAGYYTMERLDYEHPILKPFSDFQKKEIPTFKFFALPTVTEGQDNRKLAYFSNGSPAVVEDGFGLGRIILIAGAITPDYSDLASHSFFVPFIIRTMEYLSGNISSYELQNYIGQSVGRSLPASSADMGAIQLLTPDNRSYLLTGMEKGDRVVFDCRPIDIPGIYQLNAGDRTLDIFPANIPSAEGDLTAASYDQYGRAIGLTKYTVIPYNKSSATVVTESRFGRELWKIFLWAAAIVMAVEMFLSRDKSPSIESP